MRKSEGPKAFFAALAVTAVGVVWFVGGLALNIFFFYPIILIIAGVIGMIANLGGLFREQRQPQLPPRPLPYAPPSQPMYYPAQQPPMMPQAMPQMAPAAGFCWQCGTPNQGRAVCLSCGAAQPTQPSQQPMGAYGAPPGYPPTTGYPPAPAYPPAPGYAPAPNYPPTPGYPSAPAQPPTPASGGGQPSQAPQSPHWPQSPQQQGW